MPRHSSNILDLARRGAEQRFAELKAEIAALVKDFPHLGGQGRRGAGRSAGNGGAATGRRRRRRKMSAAARKAVSERMKKYWAGRRSAKQAARK